MADIYPKRPRIDTNSNAELRMYEALSTKLPDSYAVFHSVSWLTRDLHGGALDGEADFVIAHPDHGILVLEVKGGRIRYEGPQNKWYSNDHEIKDPFLQAKNNKYSLLEKLKDLPFWRHRWISMAHAVAFPDVVVKHDLRLDAPQRLIFDANDLDNVTDWIEQVFDYWRGQDDRHKSPGRVGVEELIRLLSPSWDIHTPLAVEFAEEVKEFIRLTEEQFYLLDVFSETRRMAIAGCAGSGKTTMALEQARRLGRQGFRVLVTCFNRNLAEFLRSDDSLNANVSVLNFHELCLEMAKMAGLDAQSGRDRNTTNWYNVVLPEILLEGIGVLGPQFDAIVVDEGQDFQPDWWLPLQCLLEQPDHGILYIFHDDNQNIFRTGLDLPDGLVPARLTRNCRNTQLIHHTLLPFYRASSTPQAIGPQGRSPQISFYADENQLRSLLRKALHELVMREDIPTHDIVILTPRSRSKSALWRWDTLGNFRVTDQWSHGSGEVYCNGIYQFKGLESPVVILAELYPSKNQDLDALLYVGCSRARNHLMVFCEETIPGDIRERLLR